MGTLRGCVRLLLPLPLLLFLLPLLGLGYGHVLGGRALHAFPRRFQSLGRAEQADTVVFTVHLRQRNVDVLKQWLFAVSDPLSPLYGKTYTKAEIDALVAPDDQSVQQVLAWMDRANIGREERTVVVDHIQVSTTVSKASLLLHTTFHVFHDRRTDRVLLRQVGTFSVPDDLEDVVEIITGLSELPSPSHREKEAPQLRVWRQAVARLSSFPSSDDQTTEPLVTPTRLKDYHGIPHGRYIHDNATKHCVGTFEGSYSPDALAAFHRELGYDADEGIDREMGPFCQHCDRSEGNIDVQWISAMGRGALTWFWNVPDREWMLSYFQDVYALEEEGPFIHSISYGWAEDQQCKWAERACSTFGYSNEEYERRADVELMKLGCRRITVVVADGDDGVMSMGDAPGNCPVDLSKICVRGGDEACEALKSDSSWCRCGSIHLETAETTNCILPMGVQSDECYDILLSHTSDFLAAMKDMRTQYEETCNYTVASDTGDMLHICSACPCSELKPITQGAVTIRGYDWNMQYGHPFTPVYPAASPYVTSVGATMFLERLEALNTEVTASIKDGSSFTTGGGFSMHTPMPAYQRDAVTRYLASAERLPPTGFFNASNRAYPDLVMNGDHAMVMTSLNADGTCPCKKIAAHGSSVSAPTLAGVLSLVNQELRNRGLPVLGFLNPLLYEMADKAPEIFHDIRRGDNRCTRAYCCEEGFEAIHGWDPVTGLGSLSYPAFLTFFLRVHGHSDAVRTETWVTGIWIGFGSMVVLLCLFGVVFLVLHWRGRRIEHPVMVDGSPLLPLAPQ